MTDRSPNHDHATLGVALVVTLDTKEDEAAFVVEELEARGARPIVIDVGVLGEPARTMPGVDHASVAAAAGHTLAEVQQAGSRGAAVELMQQGAINVLTELHERGELHGALVIGGAEGAVVGAGTLRTLPIGFPKFLLSPVLSGKRTFEPFVGVSDMVMMHSVVDIAGINPVSIPIYRNAVAAIVGMAAAYQGRQPQPDGRFVGVTMLGNTDRAVKQLSPQLAELGWEPVIFHSNGAGGRAMEELAATGRLQALIDLTTNELADEVCGGLQAGGPDRMARSAELGLPTVVGLACSDFFVVPAREGVPDRLRDRATYYHNPEYLLVRLTADEMLEVADRIVAALNRGSGPLTVCFPADGLSIGNHPGGPFFDPDADRAFFQRIDAGLRPDAERHIVNAHVNDPKFAAALVAAFRSLLTPSRTQS